MASKKTFRARMSNLFDTAANWLASDPVLEDGELSVVQTAAGKIKLKIGNNGKKWSEIPFFTEDLENSLAETNTELATKSSVTLYTWEEGDV